MVGFPIAWDYEAGESRSLPFSCPYSELEMAEYLYGVHYHWAADEVPLRLGDVKFLADLDTRDRHFWLWRTDDQFGRGWNLVVGTGRSPFHDDNRHCHRWIYAEEAMQEEPHAVLLRASKQHP